MSERHVRPYRHVLREGIWYLIAYDTQRTDWRLFRLDRIQHATPEHAPTGVNVPGFPSTSIQDWLTTDFGRLRTHDD